MNLRDAIDLLITCDKGMGRMLPQSCARLYLVANEQRPGTLQRDCEGCTGGELRAGHVAIEPRLANCTGRLNGAADRPCAFCGGAYAPTNRRQRFCKRDECKAGRARAASKQAYRKGKMQREGLVDV